VDIGRWSEVEAFIKSHPGITHIVNCAAFTQVDAAEERREEAFLTNAVGPENLLRTGCKLIHISTDYVFPGAVKEEQTEEGSVAPCNYYGETKLEGERRVLPGGACVIRTSWVFGNGGHSFVAKLWRMMQTEAEIRLTDDQWSKFTYAPDLANAILLMLNQTGLYQYANSGVASRYEFGVAMLEEAKALGLPVRVERILPVPGSMFPTPCKRPAYSAMDTGKIAPFVMIRHWKEALREFLCKQQAVYL
jgi:dTDP-4-dehydrorhamnose reductase